MISTDSTSETDTLDWQESANAHYTLSEEFPDEGIFYDAEDDTDGVDYVGIGRWSKFHVIILLLALVLLAALVVFVALPAIDNVMTPDAPPALQPPVKV